MTPSPPITPAPARAHLLIIDDRIDELRLLLSLVRQEDYRISVAFDGAQGYHRAQALRPDLILMDVSMPVLNGFDACRLLRSDPSTAHIPIIFLSSASGLDARLEGLNNGGVDYVIKPYDAEEVLARIKIHLRRPSAEEMARPPPGSGDRPGGGARQKQDPGRRGLPVLVREAGAPAQPGPGGTRREHQRKASGACFSQPVGHLDGGVHSPGAAALRGPAAARDHLVDHPGRRGARLFEFGQLCHGLPHAYGANALELPVIVTTRHHTAGHAGTRRGFP